MSISTSVRRFEEKLPPVASGVVRLNRVAVEQGAKIGKAVYDRAHAVVSTVTRRALDATSTVRGQARSAASQSKDAVTEATEAVGDAAKTVRSSVDQVTGQAEAQADATIDLTEEEAASALDDAADALEDRPTGSYENWTKTELYDRAQELDIDGRSTMNKSELIEALRSV